MPLEITQSLAGGSILTIVTVCGSIVFIPGNHDWGRIVRHTPHPQNGGPRSHRHRRRDTGTGQDTECMVEQWAL